MVWRLLGRLLLAAVVLPAFAAARIATAADRPTGPAINPFACRGDAEALVQDLSVSQRRDELRKHLARVDAMAGEPDTVRAHALCVVAELMRSVGDRRAGKYYAHAIAANPEEPGYELWYAEYLGRARGAAMPLVEAAERHYYAALEKLDRRAAAGNAPPFDAITRDWVDKGLTDLYQRDGAPLLPFWKGRPHHPRGRLAPGLFVASTFQIARDTTGFDQDSEMRGFTGEALFAGSEVRLGRPLTPLERWNLVRAPLRYASDSRARIRHNYLGALDFIYTFGRQHDLQIADFSRPNELVDLTVHEIGAGYGKAFGLYPLFDLGIELSYKHTIRQGFIEFAPRDVQRFGVFEVRPTVARNIGPDRLTLGGTYVYMAIPDLETGIVSERARGRTIRAGFVDYALYRPMLLPQLGRRTLRRGWVQTRGWHWYGGFAQDDEVYGVRTVTRRDIYAGTRLLGLGAWDFAVQATAYTGHTSLVDVHDPDLPYRIDRDQSNANIRMTYTVSRRIVDEAAFPVVPKSRIGVAPTSVVLVFPVRHDQRLRGPDDFENLRAGAQVWLKLLAGGLGGTTFLLSGGYDYQLFHRIRKHMHLAHLAVRMGF